MLVNIDVTQDCINRGNRFKSESCPIHHGIQPLLRSGISAIVGPWTVIFVRNSRMKDEEVLHRVINPVEAYDLITRFDSQLAVSPICFPLDIPEHLLKEIISCS